MTLACAPSRRVRALDLPPQAETGAPRRARGRRDRAHARCRRRSGRGGDAAAAARRKHTRPRCRGKALRRGAARLARCPASIGPVSACRPTGRRSADSSPRKPRRCARCCVAVIGDVRLVVVQARRAAAEHALRQVGWTRATKRKLAIETREVYAPLANRLGVWQVKWELEDLAFRYLQPVPTTSTSPPRLKVARVPSANATSRS